MARLYATDCEGPISKNDNAFELSQEFIPDGGGFFAKLSKYDDYLADVAKKPGYKAGDTLKLILPFFKAYGMTDAGIREFSSRNILLIPGVGRTLELIRRIMPTFIISTSYRPYINALCELIGFPVENTYCTELALDDYPIPQSEVGYLKELHDEILALPAIEFPSSANSRDELDSGSLRCIDRLDEIFWKELPGLASGRLLKEVNPVGGFEKAEAIKKSCRVTGTDLKDVMYVGDSITDVQAFQLVREHGGLAVSFNGNPYAVRKAEIAVLSSYALTVFPLADWFERYGKEGVIELVQRWGDPFPQEQLRIVLITDENREVLAKESTAFRKTVRGEAVARLG